VILLLVSILRTSKSLARPHFLCFYACTVASSIGTCILRHGKVGNFKLFQFHGAQTEVLKTFGNNNEQDLFYLSMRSQHNCFHGKWTCFEGAVTKTKLARLRGRKFPICTVDLLEYYKFLLIFTHVLIGWRTSIGSGAVVGCDYVIFSLMTTVARCYYVISELSSNSSHQDRQARCPEPEIRLDII
jgi:hypothetical protein